jgi:hypothetical protein
MFNQLLLQSAQKGDLDGVKKALAQKADLNYRGPASRNIFSGHPLDFSGASRGIFPGMTALYIAIHYGHLDVIQFLCVQGADVNIRIDPVHDLEGCSGFDFDTSLCLAIEKGWFEVVELLCNRGEKFNGRYIVHRHYCPVMIAVSTGNLPLVNLLCNRGAGVNTTMVSTSFSGALILTPLCIAAQNGDADMVKYLLSRGALLKGKGYVSGEYRGYNVLKQAHPSVVPLLKEVDSAYLFDSPDNWNGQTIPPSIVQSYRYTITESSGFGEAAFRLIARKLKLEQPFRISFDYDSRRTTLRTLTLNAGNRKIYASEVVEGHTVYLVALFGFDQSQFVARQAGAAGAALPPGSPVARSRRNSASAEWELLESLPVASASLSAPVMLPPSADMFLSFPAPPGSASVSAASALSVSSLTYASAAGTGARPSASASVGSPISIPPPAANAQDELLAPPKGSVISHFNEGKIFNSVIDEDL